MGDGPGKARLVFGAAAATNIVQAEQTVRASCCIGTGMGLNVRRTKERQHRPAVLTDIRAIISILR